MVDEEEILGSNAGTQSLNISQMVGDETTTKHSVNKRKKRGCC